MDLQWTTEKRKVSDLIPYEINPRKMSEKQVNCLTDSLKKFSLVELPAIDKDNKIIAGHQRVSVMMMIGWQDKEIDVRVPNRALTPAEFKEYNLRSNANTGDWDLDILSAHFEISELQDIGFEPDFINTIFDLGLVDKKETGGGVPDDLTCPECGHTWEA